MLRWFRENFNESAAIEIKATNGSSIPISALQPHQKQALLDAMGHGIVFKIPDMGRRNPFDAFMLKNAKAFVVACFTSRGICYLIPVEEWKGVRLSNPPKSQVMHI